MNNENNLIFLAVVVLLVVAVGWFVSGHYLLAALTLIGIIAFIAYAGRRPHP